MIAWRGGKCIIVCDGCHLPVVGAWADDETGEAHEVSKITRPNGERELHVHDDACSRKALRNRPKRAEKGKLAGVDP